jgi:poly-gamma-glutamate capsule biosynthesis protein CapA/YwtB (metallophosphatase superfamily)
MWHLDVSSLVQAVSVGLLSVAVAGVSVAAADSSPAVSPPPSPAATAEAPNLQPALAAYVPVLRFWSPERDISMPDLRAAIEGRNPDFHKVLLAADDPAALWVALDVTPAETTRTASVAEVERAVDGSRRVLGLLPAAEVGPDLRALGVDGLTLFGSGRLDDLSSWPLTTGAADGVAGFDPTRTWTLAAGGDVMLDREVYRKSVTQKKGPDYPWNGGFAEITSRTCCTVDGGPAITTNRVGPRGLVRKLLSAADIAIVNHEGPAPNDHSYHPGGFTFTFDPALLEGVANAGVDIVSLANNHIRNAGSKGVLETIRNLRKWGVRSMGAGKDPEAARKPACFDQHDVRVCFLGYNAINTAVHAVSDQRAGAAELVIRDIRADIKQLRRDGADVIAVLPHWGPEYVTRVTSQQRNQARAMVRAGADVVLGAHSHVTGPVEFIDDAPVLYSMGDLIFDLSRFEATEVGVIAELTFHGDTLVQLELHPTVIVDRSQVNLLDRERDGNVVINRMRQASKRLD